MVLTGDDDIFESHGMEKMNDALNQMVNHIVDAFNSSNYPRSAFYINIEGALEIEIRMPPSLPLKAQDAIMSLEAFRALPSIEVIKLEPKLQRLGIFTILLKKLSELPHVRAVVVSNVENKDFVDVLVKKCAQADSNWKTYKGGFFPSFAYWVDPNDPYVEMP